MTMSVSPLKEGGPDSSGAEPVQHKRLTVSLNPDSNEFGSKIPYKPQTERLTV